jgi:hypothetical protein
MTAATGVSDSSAPGSAEPLESSDGVTDWPSAVTTAPPDGADVETRHRLRRALRILTAARRRDDGGAGHSDS